MISYLNIEKKNKYEDQITEQEEIKLPKGVKTYLQ
jgi:hypothetical protein